MVVVSIDVDNNADEYLDELDMKVGEGILIQ